MTIEEYDRRTTAGEAGWIKDEATGMAYKWTGWKRCYDPRLMTSTDPSIPLDPIDDTLVGQWVAGNLAIPTGVYYASTPGSQGMARSGQVLDVEVSSEQTALTVNSSPDLLERCRKECLQRLIVTMEKSGAIALANFSAV